MPKTALFSLHGHSRPSKQTLMYFSIKPSSGSQGFFGFLTYILTRIPHFQFREDNQSVNLFKKPKRGICHYSILKLSF